MIRKYFYDFNLFSSRSKIYPESVYGGGIVVELVIIVCEILGPAAALGICLTLLAIALGKVRV